MHKLITTTPTIHRATISIKIKIAPRNAPNTLFAVLRGSWSSLKTLPLCSATRLPPKEEEARGFASPPHDGFAFIAESTPTPRGDAPAHVQVDTIGGWGSSSPGCLEGVFSETGLPVSLILGNWASDILDSRKLSSPVRSVLGNQASGVWGFPEAYRPRPASKASFASTVVSRFGPLAPHTRHSVS